MKKIELTTTLFPDNQKSRVTQCMEFHPDLGLEKQLVNLYPQVTYQEFQGFGGACTDAAAYVYSLMSEAQKRELIHCYFDENQLNYSLVRMTIDSCDFSLEHYQAVNDPEDKDWSSFSLERAGRYVFPMMDDMKNISGKQIEVMVSPWSPPAFMKTNGERNHGGKLCPEYYGAWADYMCRYICEYRRRGYLIKRLTLQNEPKAVQTWDSCVYTAEEEKIFLRDYLYPALKKHNLTDIQIFIWDHNKERVFERACAIIDAETDSMVQGIAFHWYSGDHFEALELIRNKFPDKILALSEACIEYSKYRADDYLENAQKYAHDMIGNMNHGMAAFYDWNLLLDETGGPNHVGNLCDAPFLYDRNEKKLIERNTLSYIWHFSSFIKAGARRIGFSRYTDQIEITAFVNPDDTIVVILLNRGESELVVNLRLDEEVAALKIAGKAIATGIIIGKKESSL